MSDAPTWVVGLSLQRLQLSALGQGVLQAELQEAGLRPAHPLQQRQQSHRLLALVPSLEPAGQHAHLITKHHGPRDGVKADRLCRGGATSSELGTDGRRQQSSLLICGVSVRSR